MRERSKRRNFEFYSAIGEKSPIPCGNSGNLLLCTLMSGFAMRLLVLSLLSNEMASACYLIGLLNTLWQILPTWRLSELQLWSFYVCDRNNLAFLRCCRDRSGSSIVSNRSFIMQSCIASLLGIDD